MNTKIFQSVHGKQKIKFINSILSNNCTTAAITSMFPNVMPSVQSVFKQSKLSRRQRRGHRYSATSAPEAATPAAAGASSATALPKAYRNTVPIVHGIVVSNLSLVLLQKEYKEQFYFEKRSGGGGPDPDANADSYRHLNGKHQPHNRFNTQLQLLRFG